MGTSCSVRSGSIFTLDHPHAYGDKWLSKYDKNMAWGSSPRVWGQGVRSIPSPVRIRIIPTRMGTSTRRTDRRKSGEDHPHAYGDKSLCFEVLALVSGSSPRVWGQGYSVPMSIQETRIIPTRMGTRIISSLGFPIAWDHPHAYGDKIILTTKHILIRGSSPRVWGQVYMTKKLDFIHRIIPTRVGTRCIAFS